MNEIVLFLDIFKIEIFFDIVYNLSHNIINNV
jgi:hypothetical protein